MSSLFHDDRFADSNANDGQVWLIEDNVIEVVPDNNLLSKESCIVIKRFDLLKVLLSSREKQGDGGNSGKLNVRFNLTATNSITIEFNGDIMSGLLEGGLVAPLKQH